MTETSDGLVHCQCHHLTNFAILLDVSQQHADNIYFTVLTWSGCVLSLFGLFFTILAYATIKKVKHLLQSKIYVRLCVSLSCLLIVFLAFSENRSGNAASVFCKVSSFFIHYFLLLTFMWKGTCAISMYKMFANPMESFDQNKFLFRMTIVNFMVPTLVAITTAALNSDNLSDSKTCMLRGTSFYISVLTPIVVIILFNVIVVAIVVRSIFKPSIVNTPAKTTTWKQCRITIFISVLLGATWTFALFGIGEVSIVFQIIFCVFAPLQGFFIFLMFVVYPKEMRPIVMDIFSKLLCRKIKEGDSITLTPSSPGITISSRISTTTVVAMSDIEEDNMRCKPVKVGTQR